MTALLDLPAASGLNFPVNKSGSERGQEWPRHNKQSSDAAGSDETQKGLGEGRGEAGEQDRGAGDRQAVAMRVTVGAKPRLMLRSFAPASLAGWLERIINYE
jgi:hypothetical protein